MLCITGHKKVWQNSKVPLTTCSSMNTGRQRWGAKACVIFLCSSGSVVKTPGWPTNLTLAPAGMERCIMETTLKVISSLSSSTLHSPAAERMSRTGSVRKIAKMLSEAESTCASSSFLSFSSKLASLGYGNASGLIADSSISPSLSTISAFEACFLTKLGATGMSRNRPSSSSTTSRPPVGQTSRFTSRASHRTTSPEVRSQMTYLYWVSLDKARKTPLDVQQLSSTSSRIKGTASSVCQAPSASDAPTTRTSS
mmetsp:Transcript_158910/g.509689  ORF Transcript_158910/g.509689 Transcript_158910/m.509689 type:complete len:254 (-) Transcript_158910:125-886(-)